MESEMIPRVDQVKPRLWGWRTILTFGGILTFVALWDSLGLLSPLLADLVKFLSGLFFGTRSISKASYYIGQGIGSRK